MTVRRRLLGSVAAFTTALVLITSAQAQDRRDPTTDDVKARLEAFLNRARAAREPQPLPPGMTPEQAMKLGELARKFGITPSREGKLTPEQLEQLRDKIKGDPAFKDLPGGNKGEFGPGGMKKKDGPVGNAKPGPIPNGKGGFTPGPKDEPLPKLPATRLGPREVPPEPVSKIPGKNGEPPFPPPPRQGPPPGLKDPDVELPPWQKPESPQDKARQAAAAVWENNIGPLKETPAVEKALFDIVDGTGDLKDPDGNNLWDTLSKEMGNGKGFGDLFNGLDGSGGGDWNFGDYDWSFPKLNWNFNWGNNRPPDVGSAGPPRESWFSKWRRSPSSSSSSSNSSWFSGWKAPRWNIGVPSLDGTWWPILIVIAALVGGVFLWRWLAGRGRHDPYRIDPYALGPWPVDPHHLTTRQDVVVAFEHLSVLLCGPVAKTWTHTTIAEALSEVAMAEPQRALMLARLYELARYTPIEEPLTTAELAEARRLVCRLAGFTDD